MNFFLAVDNDVLYRHTKSQPEVPNILGLKNEKIRKNFEV
jgi:hypothetical protein